MRQVLLILVALALCLLIARLLPTEGEMAKTLRAVFYVIGAALGALFLYVLARAAISGV